MFLSRLWTGPSLLTVGCLLNVGMAFGQASAPKGTALPLNDLTSFRNPVGGAVAKNWRVAGDAAADPFTANAMTAGKGSGVLVNLPAKPEYGGQFNLATVVEHGDMDLELDYMMAKGSNSGVYLQGRYEIQLFDSWGVKTPKVVDNGSIYERWDESRPEGQKGYEGYPARQNASRAPGLWQHLKVSFQAPRFDAGGRKTENARILRAELNGVLIHENVELTGPTRSGLGNNEVAVGPLVLQGDHGPVAFRNIRYTLYDKARPELTNLKYAVYKGKFEKDGEFGGAAPEAEGPTGELNPGVSPLANEFGIRYTGTLRVKEPGLYTFNLGAPGGYGSLKINNQPVVGWKNWSGNGQATLPAGDLPFELQYAKNVEWMKPKLNVLVEGPGVRQFALNSSAIDENDEADPILVTAPTNTVLRSFMDVTDQKDERGKTLRVVHAVSVGSPDNVHYTYDLDKGALVQVWRGTFLDATPMWENRGDGSARPTGMVQRFGKPTPLVGKLAAQTGNWPTDTTGSSYRPKGYVLDEQDRPTFRYLVYGTMVNDQLRVLDGGQGFRREVTVDAPTGDLYARLAEGSAIEALPNGLYSIDGRTYFVKLDDAAGAKPSVRTVNGRQELIVPVRGKLSYSILF